MNAISKLRLKLKLYGVDVLGVLFVEGVDLAEAAFAVFLFWLVGGFPIPNVPLSYQFFGFYVIINCLELSAAYYYLTHLRRREVNQRE